MVFTGTALVLATRSIYDIYVDGALDRDNDLHLGNDAALSSEERVGVGRGGAHSRSASLLPEHCLCLL